MLSPQRYLWCRCAGALVCLLAVVAWSAPAAAQSEFRAVWADAFHAGYKSTAEIDQLVAHLATARYNVIIPEILAYHDNVGSGHGAYWNSSIVPKASDITGGIDPLAYLIQQAHAEGIEVHGWIVAFRSCTTWPPSGNATVATHPEWIMVPQASAGGGVTPVGGAYQFDPGSSDVQDYLMSIIQEVVNNYEIDGIHWDYIRYTQVDAGYPSDLAYANSGLARFQRITGRGDTPPPSGDAQWNDFRRRTIDEVVRRCRAEIAAATSNPRQPLRHTAALITWGDAPASFTSTSAFGLFQNWEMWMREGFLDGSVPMIYHREHDSNQAQWYRNWVDATLNWRYARHAYPGQATYLNSMANSVTQMQYSYNQGADGTSNYSYYATADNDLNGSWENDWSWYTSYCPNNMFTYTASVPTMPWRDLIVATEGTVWGQITDAVSGNPVDDVSVQVGSLDPVFTDGNGYYVRTLVPDSAGGTFYDITLNKMGYDEKTYYGAMVVAGDLQRYNITLGDPPGPPPTIELDPTLINRLVIEGNDLANDMFSIRTPVADSVLEYTITRDVTWLSLSPTAGTSTGEADPIDIIYHTSFLAIGNYTANITVTDPAATNSPQTLIVNLKVANAIPPDFDFDGDVDANDTTYLLSYMTGPEAGPPTPGCVDADLDLDGDIDQSDFGCFQRCLSGEFRAPRADCGGNCQSDSECSDGLFCNGIEYCAGGFCRSGLEACPGQFCDETADACVECYTGGDCNDGVSCTIDTCNGGACDNAPNDAICDDGLFCNGVETCDPVADCQAGSDPCGGYPCDEDNDVCQISELWMSFRSNTTVPGVGAVADEDIVAYDLYNTTWSLVFDGSDVGVGGLEISALALLPTGEILLSFTASGTIPGMTGGPGGSETANDTDIIMFAPTSLGADTAGSFSFYFDGSDVELDTSNEDIDGLTLDDEGRLVVTTTGGFSTSNASGNDEDLFTFHDTTLGENTSGWFEQKFDGSDVGLADGSGEDVDAASLTPPANLLLSTSGSFSVTGISGGDEDVIEFTPTQWGTTTSGTYQMFLDLSSIGIDAGADVGSLELVN
ncbi:MAG: family 10 glycosylhydrolase [Planctomycetota bacterium]|jgi:uncharacterized lipoprotein YddW (UPF0748 family)